MEFLLDLPFVVSFVLVCVVCVAVANLGLWLVRKKFAPESLKENHEVAASIFNAYGMLYAVVVAFVVFVTWTRYDEASKNIELEASEASDLFFVANVFPDTLKKQVRQALSDYMNSIYNDEWKAMLNGESSPKTVDAVRKLMHVYISMDVKSLDNVPAYQESFKRLNDLAQYRRLRNYSAADSVPNVIWVVLLLGAIIEVIYTYFFGVKKAVVQYCMTSALTVTLTLILVLIFTLDHPFKGTNAVSSAPIKNVSEMMGRIVQNQNK